MRVFNQGSFIRITVSRSEVEAFADTWPCSGLPHRGISFTFNARNGDLVDLAPADIDGEALVALSEDAFHFAEVRKLAKRYKSI